MSSSDERAARGRGAHCGFEGFSLLELLVVVSLLAGLAGVALWRVHDAERSARLQLALHEIAEVRRALRQFRADTGFLPKQGRFALVSDPLPGEVGVPAQGEAWFHSPANLVQLFEPPLGADGEPVMPWSPDTGRGWRGPYLSRQGDGLVDIGADLTADGSGDPASGALLGGVPALADPFVARPLDAYLLWRDGDSGQVRARSGQPYLLFDLDGPDARVVSMGPDRRYGSGGAGDDDLVLGVLR